MVVIFNRAVNLVVWLVLGLIAIFALFGFLFPAWDRGFAYGVFAIGMPVALLLAVVVAPVAVGFYWFGKWNGFWASAAPLNLAFLCLAAAFAAIPPPPATGAAVSAVLGIACAAILWRKEGVPRKIGLLPALALPFAGMIPALACWAPLAASLVFGGVWAATRWRAPSGTVAA